MIANMFPVVILAGGFATRLRPVTEKIPKALIDINGEPFILHQLRLLKQHHIKDIIICISYLGEMIQACLGNGFNLGLNIRYSMDGEKLLGTAGAIKKALPLLEDNFFVLYGDSYLPCDYQAVQHYFMQQNQLGLMTIFKNESKWDKSNVEYDKGELVTYDKNNITSKMNYIDYGLGIFNKKVFDIIPPGTTYDLALLYQHLLKEKQLCAYEIFKRFYEVGSFVGVEEFQHYIKNQSPAPDFL